MAPATGTTVLGDFADTTFERDGVVSRFRRRDGKFVVHTDGADRHARRLRGRLHVRCRAAGRPPAGAHDGLGCGTPQLVRPLSQRADAARRRAALDESLSELERHVRYALAILYLQRNDWTRAEEAATRLAALSPADP